MIEKTVGQLLEEQNSLLRDQNKLIEQSNATASGLSHRDDMRRVAREWDRANPVMRFLAINPYGKWK